MTKGKKESLTLHQQQLDDTEVEKLALFMQERLGEQLKYFERWNGNQWLSIMK